MLVSFAVLALVCSASAAPREKFDAFDGEDIFSQFSYTPFPFAYSFARPFGAFSGAFPFFRPVPFIIPVPEFTPVQYTPWYKGPNVCESKKMMEEPQELKEWMSDGFQGTFDYSHESQSCRGNNDKYACIRRVQTNDGAKMEMTKYECCYGFVRATDGKPGCIESSKGKNSAETGTSPTQIKMQEKYKYNVFQGKFNGGKSGVENVPIQ